MSSKITEKNIADSVFDGLAQEESVQAVLDAVSGGLAQEDTSQEILTKLDSDVNAVYKALSVSCAASSTTTAINITGKGKLYGIAVLVNGNSNATVTTTLNIDGNTYTYSVQSSSGNNGYKVFALYPASMISFYASDSGVIPGLANIIKAVANKVVGLENASYSTPSTTGGEYAVQMHCIIKDYIEFNESLTITVNNAIPSAGQCRVLYTLDE